MKPTYVLGICFDNNDPNNLGRIRAVPISEVGTTWSLKDITTYISSQDNAATSQNLYKPWYSTILPQIKGRDKYLCEPFLPKNFGLLPVPGQLIKIIQYEKDGQTEFIGPYTIDQITLTEEYRNVVRNLQKNLSLSEVLPKKTKTFISGYNNEQVILGENEVLIRLAYVDSDKTRKDTYPFIQLNQYDNSYDIENVTTTTTESKNPAINYIAQLYIDYTPKVNTSTEQNIVGTLILFDASKILNNQNKLGLSKNSYSSSVEYITETTDSYVVKHVISTSNFNDFTTILTKILQSYKNDSAVLYYDTTNTNNIQTVNDKTKNQTIIIYNNLTNNPTAGGGINDNPNQITGGLRNWKFRLNPSTNIKNYSGTLVQPQAAQNSILYINYSDFTNLNQFINSYGTELNFGELSDLSDTIIVSKQDVPVQTGLPQSVQTTYSDKFLFLSSLNSPGLIDDVSSDGINATKVAELLYGTNENLQTYGFVRAEPLLNLMNDLINALLTHGHVQGIDPRSSVIDASKETLVSIQKRILDELKQNQNNVIVNHNFRLN